MRLTSAGGHPGADETKGVIRRWIAPAEGEVTVTGTLKHTRSNSDGVIAMIRSNDSTRTFTVANSTVETVSKNIKVLRDQPIDMIASPGKTSTADAHVWIVEIKGVGGDLLNKTWKSDDDFQAPPPPPLDPLAQLAQALMLTNEFLYLD